MNISNSRGNGPILSILDSLKKFLSLRRIAEIATVIGLIVTLYQVLGTNKQNTPPKSNQIATPEQQSSTLKELKPSPSEDTPKIVKSTPTKVVEYATITINKYISRYNDKINFGITDIKMNGTSTIINFYIENNSNLEVSVPIFKNVFLIDKNKEQIEADSNESDRFLNIQSGVKQSGEIKFQSKLSDGESYTFRSLFYLLDAGDKTINIPFVIKQ